MYDAQGKVLKRFFRLETLAASVEGMVRQKDWFIVPSVQSMLGPSEVTSLAFHLFLETDTTLSFRLDAANARRKRASFMFVAAKNDKECSTAARNEHTNLGLLAARAPDAVARPFRGGTLYLPDRHRREDHNRVVFAYVTQWLPGHEPLTLENNLQLGALGARRHTFTIADTEEMKAQMASLIARAYDAKRRDGIAAAHLTPADFLVRRTARGLPKLKLIACRRMAEKLSPAALLHELLSASWEAAGKRMPLAPSHPEALWESLVAALDRDTAAKWMRQYLDALTRGRFKQDAGEYVAGLREIVVK